MEWFVRGFIRASLVWLGVGVTIGVGMIFVPYHALAYRPAHLHANLLGFVSMMIFGVAYHVVPRFTGNRLHSTRLAALHFFVANAGLALMVGGFILRVTWPGPGTIILVAGGGASAVAAFLFIYNMWRSTAPRPAGIPLGSVPPGQQRK